MASRRKPKTITPKTKANRPLTKKQQAFVDYIVANPKASHADAARHAYNIGGKHGLIQKDVYTASEIARENLQKPAIISELAKYNNLVESTLLNTVNDWGRSEKLGERALAVDTSKFIHDKLHGRAKQSVELQSTSVNINIDLAATVVGEDDSQQLEVDVKPI